MGRADAPLWRLHDFSRSVSVQHPPFDWFGSLSKTTAFWEKKDSACVKEEKTETAEG